MQLFRRKWQMQMKNQNERFTYFIFVEWKTNDFHYIDVEWMKHAEKN